MLRNFAELLWLPCINICVFIFTIYLQGKNNQRGPEYGNINFAPTLKGCPRPELVQINDTDCIRLGSRTITPRTITPQTITPLGQIPPGQLPPQITEFPKHKSTKFTSHKVYKSQSLQVTKFTSHKSTQITGTKSQYIRVQILQNTSKYKGSAWLWQTLVIWWLLKKPFWGGIKPKT